MKRAVGKNWNLFFLTVSLYLINLFSEAHAVVTQNSLTLHAAEGTKKYNKGVGCIEGILDERGTLLALTPRILITNRHVIDFSKEIREQLGLKNRKIQIGEQTLSETSIQKIYSFQDQDLSLIILNAETTMPPEVCLHQSLYQPSVHGPLIEGLTPIYGVGWGKGTQYDAEGHATDFEGDRHAFISFLDRQNEKHLHVENNENLGAPKHKVSGGCNNGDSGAPFSVFVDESNQVIHRLDQVKDWNRRVVIGINASGTDSFEKTLNQLHFSSHGFSFSKENLKPHLRKLQQDLSLGGTLKEEIKALTSSFSSYVPSASKFTSLDFLLTFEGDVSDFFYHQLVSHAAFEYVHSCKKGTQTQGFEARLWSCILDKLADGAAHTSQETISSLKAHYEDYWKKYQAYACFGEACSFNRTALKTFAAPSPSRILKIIKATDTDTDRGHPAAENPNPFMGAPAVSSAGLAHPSPARRKISLVGREPTVSSVSNPPAINNIRSEEKNISLLMYTQNPASNDKQPAFSGNLRRENPVPKKTYRTLLMDLEDQARFKFSDITAPKSSPSVKVKGIEGPLTVEQYLDVLTTWVRKAVDAPHPQNYGSKMVPSTDPRGVQANVPLSQYKKDALTEMGYDEAEVF